MDALKKTKNNYLTYEISMNKTIKKFLLVADKSCLKWI